MAWESWAALLQYAERWQSLIAGLLGFTAAIVAVVLTLRSEYRREERAMRAMRRALLSEMWGLAGQALHGHQVLVAILRAGEMVRVHDLEDAARFPALVIYPNIAGKLGALGEDAHDIIRFFQQLQALKDTLERVRRDFDRAEIGMENPEDAVESLLELAETAVLVFPSLSVGPADVRALPNFAAAIEQARRDWDRHDN